MASNKGRTTVDFGATPSSLAETAVADATIIAGAYVEAWLEPTATATNNVQAHVSFGPRICAGTVSAGVGFTIYASAANIPGGVLTGEWSVAWVWTDLHMAGFQSVIVDDTGGYKAEVKSDQRLQINLPTDPAVAGHALIATENDDGSFAAGTNTTRTGEIDIDYRLRVAIDQPIWREAFEGTAVNTTLWNSALSTMTQAVADGYMKLNNGASAGASTRAQITSYATFEILDAYETCVAFSLRIETTGAVIGENNTIWEVGLGLASAAADPTDGIYLRMSDTGVFTLTYNFNSGSNTSTASIPYNGAGGPGGANGFNWRVNRDYRFLLSISPLQVRLWVEDPGTGAVYKLVDHYRSNAKAGITSTPRLPFFARIRNAATPPAAATQLWVGNILISQQGTPLRGYHHILGRQGAGAHQGQSGATLGQLATWTNSADPAAATLSNTAAGYSTPGGIFIFAAPAGAATDYALFGYQVPAATVNLHNKMLRIDKVRISSVNVGAAVATTATVLAWALGVGSTAVSLATTEAATTRAPRRIPIGMQSFVVGAAIGATTNDIELDLSSAPIYVEPGSFVHIILRIPVGTATASQQIRGTVSIVGQWE